MKPWHDDIRQQIDTWSKRLGPLKWWPRFVYHFTDVHNAVSILESGALYSRQEAQRRGVMTVDCASPDVIANTRDEHLRFVRLYFRPKTPTQYRNEGIRPQNSRPLGGAHCAIPIFSCFDAFAVLAADETLYSDGNMASPRTRFGSERAIFNSIPFGHVFHEGYFPQEQRVDIILRRNAEVLIPDELPLEPTLKFVACRSLPERKTLLHLLSPDVRERWDPSVRFGHQGLFERKWTYVEEVVTLDDSLEFRFNPNSEIPGPFSVTVRYTEACSERPRTWEGQMENLSDRARFRIAGAPRGFVTLILDDAVAFGGPVTFEDIPF